VLQLADESLEANVSLVPYITDALVAPPVLLNKLIDVEPVVTVCPKNVIIWMLLAGSEKVVLSYDCVGLFVALFAKTIK
jgi:hypothetical protein